MSKQDNEQSIKTISFTLPEGLLNQVKEYAHKEDRNLSSVIRLALKKLIESEQAK